MSTNSHKCLVFLFLTILLTLFSKTIRASENPFLKMAGAPYPAYCAELDRITTIDMRKRDESWMTVVVAQMQEAAKISKDKKWLLEAEFLKTRYNYSRTVYVNKFNQKQLNRLTITHIDNLQKIVQRAEKTKAIDIKLRAMYEIWKCYAVLMQDYETGFQYSSQLDKALSKVRAEDFPPKLYHYQTMAKLYYDFDEFETAKTFCEKTLENASIAYVHKHRILESTWNQLGLIYRYYYKDLDKSDSCFAMILTFTPAFPEQLSAPADATTRFTLQDEYELWGGIAKGNLGNNYFLRGDYDNAIPLLQHGVEKSVENNPYNYPYAAGKAILLAQIFIEKQRPTEAKQYADRAYAFLIESKNRDHVADVQKDLYEWMNFYTVMSLYCRTTGDYPQALRYVDSADFMRKACEEEFNLRKLHRAEQRAEMEKLNEEILRSNTYRWGLIIISLFFLVVLTLLLFLFRFYRIKPAAYSALASKTRQWAGVAQNVPDEADELICKEFKELMTSRHLYQNPNTSLEEIASLMGINRNTLSQAINRCTGNNFPTFLNEFRIKEAVQMLSDKESLAKFSIEGIALEVGFNDRQTFHRAFKKMTGLSPSEYREKILRSAETIFPIFIAGADL